MSEEEIKNKLLQKLDKCNAPVTGIHVVCCLVTKKGYYFGHNSESENPIVFKHAEMEALSHAMGLEKNPEIISIYTSGGGNAKKLKLICPCFGCTEALSKYVIPETQVCLLPPEEIGDKLNFNFNELVLSYSNIPYSKIEGSTLKEVRGDLLNKTILKNIDVDFISELRIYGINNNVEFYLTGSSTGRGGVSSLIIKKTNGIYGDLDIICVVESTKIEKTIKDFEIMVEKYYSVFKKEERIIPEFKNKTGVLISQYFYKCGLTYNTTIDITFSKNFNNSFTYKEYQLRNWFHQIS
jgi:cytidine deaminase